MKQSVSDIAKGLRFGFWICLSFFLLAWASAGYTALVPVSTGQTLTQGLWNQMVSNVTNLNSRAMTVVASGTTTVPVGSYVNLVAGLPKTGYYETFYTPVHATAGCWYVDIWKGTDGAGLVAITAKDNSGCVGTVQIQWKVVNIQ